MKRNAIAVLAGALALGGSALAADTDCALPHDVRGAGVSRTDIGDCPGSLAGGGGYCPLPAVADVATVLVFDENGDCPVDATSFGEDGFPTAIR